MADGTGVPRDHLSAHALFGVFRMMVGMDDISLNRLISPDTSPILTTWEYAWAFSAHRLKITIVPWWLNLYNHYTAVIKLQTHHFTNPQPTRIILYNSAIFFFSRQRDDFLNDDSRPIYKYLHHCYTLINSYTDNIPNLHGDLEFECCNNHSPDSGHL